MNGENRTILKSLKGEYKRFARNVSRSVFFRYGSGEYVDSQLFELFSMLQSAQEDGVPFEEVIPDPKATRRETLAAFPRREFFRPLLIAAFCLLLIAALTAGAVMIIHYPPIASLGETANIVYDAESSTLYWDKVPRAFHYEVWVETVDEETLERTGEFEQKEDHTSLNYLYLYLNASQWTQKELSVRIVAKGETRYKDRTTEDTINLNILTAEGTLASSYQGNGNMYGICTPCIERDLGGYDPNYVKLILRPEYNFYASTRDVHDVNFALEQKDGGGTTQVIPRDLIETGYFYRVGATYTFYVNHNGGTFFGLEFDLISPDKWPEELALPVGKTLFSRYGLSQAYRSEDHLVRFAYCEFHDSTVTEFPYRNGFDVSPFVDDDLIQSKNDTYLIAYNTAVIATRLAILPIDSVEIYPDETRQSISLKAGYTTVTMPEDINWKTIFFYSKTSVLFYNSATVSRIKPEVPDGFGFYRSNLGLSKKYMFYSETDTELFFELSPSTTSADPVQEVNVLKPGLNVFNLYSYTAIRVTFTSDRVFGYVRYSEDTCTYGSEITMPMQKLGGTYFLFNPYDTDIEVKAIFHYE